MSCFALFRLPYQQQVTLVMQTSGEPLEVSSCMELSGKTGFVVAPFAPSSERPILVIRPDVVTHEIPWDELQEMPHHVSPCPYGSEDGLSY